jgi:uncharacterized protein (TIGR02147 family)
LANSVFDYRDYKAYLRDIVDERGRGERSRLASAVKCHLAYVSQVLGGNAQFSLEQADVLNQYLSHSEDEAEFFLLLVSLDRAGSASLRRRYESRVRETLHARTVLENRLKDKKVLPAESQATYYSAWYYSAVHLLISIPEFQTKEKIAARLRLPMPQLVKALDFLVSTGLATLEHGRYRTGQVTLHLKNDSPWIARHHASWRLQSVQSLERGEPGNFHYTSVVSFSDEDLPAARKILVDAIEKVREVVKKSPEKGLYCYTVDFFGV